MSWVSGTSKTSNTCLVEVTMRVPPDTEPTTEPPTKAEIILLQRAEEGLTIMKPSDAYLCQLIVCALAYNEKNAMVGLAYADPSCAITPRYLRLRSGRLISVVVSRRLAGSLAISLSALVIRSRWMWSRAKWWVLERE